MSKTARAQWNFHHKPNTTLTVAEPRYDVCRNKQTGGTATRMHAEESNAERGDCWTAVPWTGMMEDDQDIWNKKGMAWFGGENMRAFWHASERAGYDESRMKQERTKLGKVQKMYSKDIGATRTSMRTTTVDFILRSARSSLWNRDEHEQAGKATFIEMGHQREVEVRPYYNQNHNHPSSFIFHPS